MIFRAIYMCRQTKFKANCRRRKRRNESGVAQIQLMLRHGKTTIAATPTPRTAATIEPY